MKKHPLLGKLISLSLIVLTIALGLYVWQRKSQLPSTDEASIDADVTHAAAAVGGRVIRIAVSENQHVQAGETLFQIDPAPYRLAVEQAQADLALAQAALATKQRELAVQQATARIATEQISRNTSNLALATRTVERLRPLAASGYVPQQQLDQAVTAQRDAHTSLLQAKAQETAATAAIGTLDSAQATVQARMAALALAQHALANTTVKATQAGRVVGLSVSPGEMVAPSQSLFTLVNTEEWFALANFRETELKAIAPRDCVTVYSMINPSLAIKGVVQGIGWGVMDTGHITLPRSVPYVERSLNWVRVAQRFPVRIRLEHPPTQVTRLGASALVEIKHGAACKRPA
ncbi:multidrug transporter subunit MdtN [Chitinibacter tainanensis]|uniref:multidrug transporter subunit MdtN n=1 Tax=Chitinibacter tainanensis TaxID=230667 RepID=UPI0003FF3DCB|nr:multidrug transporter subunit MdtN [Chitinibacter tainanensis]